MSTATTYAHITSTPGVCGGRPRIDGHRIRVQDIAIAHEWQGHTPEQICQQFSGLTLGEVHSALAYFYDHRDEIVAEIEGDRKVADDFARDHPECVR